MSSWQSAALETEPFPHWAKPATLDVDPKAGSVELQRKNSSGQWESFEVLSDPGAFKVEVVNYPELRIATTADAMFRWTWNG